MRNRTDLLIMRTEQLLRRNLNLKKITAQIQRMRSKSKKYRDDTAGAENNQYEVRNIILLYNSRCKKILPSIESLPSGGLNFIKLFGLIRLKIFIN